MEKQHTRPRYSYTSYVLKDDNRINKIYYSLNSILFFPSSVLRIKVRALRILDKCSTPEPHPQASFLSF